MSQGRRQASVGQLAQMGSPKVGLSHLSVCSCLLEAFLGVSTGVRRLPWTNAATDPGTQSPSPWPGPVLITNRQNVQMAPPIPRWPRKGDHRFPPHLSPCISGHLCGPDPMLCAIRGGALQTLTREKLAGPRSLPSAPEPSFPFIVCCSWRQADALDDSHRAETRRLSCKPSVALNWLRPRLPVLQAPGPARHAGDS